MHICQQGSEPKSFRKTFKTFNKNLMFRLAHENLSGKQKQ